MTTRSITSSPGRPRNSTLTLLALAGALVAILAVGIALNVAGLRQRLLGGLGGPTIESIVILPFENLSNDPAQDYFAAGTTWMLVGDFQQIGGVRVIGPSSVSQYRKAPKPLPDIAQELNVDAVLQGSVQRSGDRVQLRVNLVHAPTNRRLWERTYERDLPDVLNLHADVLRDVAREIAVELTPQEDADISRPRAVNPGAYDALLRGMAADSPAKAEEYFEQAARLDPASTEPHIELADLYYGLSMQGTHAPQDIFPKARDAAQKALSLDPTRSVPHRILGSVALEYDWKFTEAEKEFVRAAQLAPNGRWAHHIYAHFLLATGRLDEASTESRRAMELDPAGSATIACVSWHDIAERQYDAAERRALRALSLGAPDQLARLTLGWSYALRNRHDEAIPEFQKAVVGWQDAVFPTAALGHAYAVAGKAAEAREVLDRLLARATTEYVSPYEIAVVYAGLGDRDRAFEWLEKAYEGRASFLVYSRMDPRIWSLRADPRFEDLLRRMNFPEDRRH